MSYADFIHFAVVTFFSHPGTIVLTFFCAPLLESSGPQGLKKVSDLKFRNWFSQKLVVLPEANSKVSSTCKNGMDPVPLEGHDCFLLGFKRPIFTGRTAVSFREGTLPETNMAPENGWLEYNRFLLGWPIFMGRTVSFREFICSLLGIILPSYKGIVVSHYRNPY